MPDPEDFDRLLPEYIRTKRELLYWRLMASIREEEVRQAQTKWPSRLSNLIESINNLRYDWKIYAMLAVCGALALLFAPLLLVIVVIPALRRRFFQALLRIKAFREVRDRVQIKIRELRGTSSEDDGWRSAQVIMRRQVSPSPLELNKDQIQAQLLLQLSPKKRNLLHRFHRVDAATVGNTENTQAQSLSVTESSLLTIYAAGLAEIESAKD